MLKEMLHALTALDPPDNVVRLSEYRAKRDRFDRQVDEMTQALMLILAHCPAATVDEAIDLGKRVMEMHPDDRDPVGLAVQAACVWAGQGGSAA